MATLTTFEFATAGRIIFGNGVSQRIGELGRELGQRALLAYGVSLEQCQGLRERLEAAGVSTALYAVAGEPSVESIQQGVALAQQEGCSLVIGVGGGSAIDTGKAIAALATNPGEVLDYLEVVGRGQPLAHPPLPYMAVPTTAGTGAEVTRNAVLSAPAAKAVEPGGTPPRVKVSLRSPLMLPRIALVDPALTYSLPPEVTASTGMDALVQLIEPYVCNRPNPLVDAICLQGIPLAAQALPRVYHAGEDSAAREAMALASLYGGLALANARLGAVHGFAGVLGGLYGAPHGVICARLLPPVTAFNLRALKERHRDHPAVWRYATVAELLAGPDASGRDPRQLMPSMVSRLDALVEELHIPRLGQYGLQCEHFPAIIQQSARASSMQGNPVVLTDEEMAEILERAM